MAFTILISTIISGDFIFTPTQWGREVIISMLQTRYWERRQINWPAHDHKVSVAKLETGLLHLSLMP